MVPKTEKQALYAHLTHTCDLWPPFQKRGKKKSSCLTKRKQISYKNNSPGKNVNDLYIIIMCFIFSLLTYEWPKIQSLRHLDLGTIMLLTSIKKVFCFLFYLFFVFCAISKMTLQMSIITFVYLFFAWKMSIIID